MNNSDETYCNGRTRGEFPHCFPGNFESEILPRAAHGKKLHVFRIIKFGKLDRKAFLSTYEEVLMGLRRMDKPLDLKDPSTYSTSCSLNSKELRYLLKISLRHNPKAFIAEGDTVEGCGPCQLTSERTGGRKSHVDWWIYRDAQPQAFFTRREEDECHG